MRVIGISGLHNSVLFKKREFPHLSARQYRIAQGFDSAAALVNGNKIEAVAAEERFSRDKATGSFPVRAIQYCLQSAGITLDDVACVAQGFSYEPFASFFEHDDFTRRQFDEVYSRQAQIRCLEAHFPGYDWAEKFVRTPHHLAHAASAFYPSGFEEALVLVTDGMGEVHSMTIAVGRGNDIQVLGQAPSLNSLGILYGVFTYYLGFYMNLDEYKVMGLAPYGNSRRYFRQVMDLVRLKDDGACEIPVLFRNTTIEEKETYGGTLRVLQETFGPLREPGAEVTQEHKDIAAALQAVLETALLHTLQHYRKETGQRRLCMAGGVALNCTANGVIKRSRMFKEMFVQPAAGDDGSALGAALVALRQRDPGLRLEKMGLPLWGPAFDSEAVRVALDGRPEFAATSFDSFDDLANDVARRVAQGQIVGWFQGRMEFGPRALGNRSILADPRHPGMRDLMNQRVKNREDFRPFAPAVTLDAAHRFFEVDEGDESLYAYMLCVAPVRQAFREQLPAVTHVDGSARVQTVTQEDNPRFWAVLKAFEKVSGIPVLLNTSFNVRGQPIVCTPVEALDTFLLANLDALAIEDYVIVRSR